MTLKSNKRSLPINGKFRDECLNENWFLTLQEAREKIERWRRDYNQARPHSALEYQTAEEFAARAAARGASPPTPLAPLSKELIPIYLRDYYQATKARMKQVRRYVSPVTVTW